VVSSTSWTPDEDFSLLLKTLAKYEQQAKSGGLPKLLALITGKGPLRNAYMAEIARLEKNQKWQWVRCVSVWLEPDDYPILLGVVLSVWCARFIHSVQHLQARRILAYPFTAHRRG
jgi:beta-1,4-mannosyltransferase